ncbi:Uncharacterised protein [Faecalicoccus pleomorphus]|uniref:Uncharacterized protein n=1 Tax=Faecalicoccus pleomorphus TaxID=1323 RepID=A0A380LNX2_9FIRM|nr:hypothetical protein [Faecalicoccus pleomorphus]SUO04947.1 Uncharacterised protein [Faecalicoccus pleomorphus]
MQNPKLILFDSVVFNTTDKTMHILDGSLVFYDYRYIKRAVILNERANHRGKSTPFLSVVPKGPGRPGVLLYSFLYVGIKIVMADHSILAIYISKEKHRLERINIGKIKQRQKKS